MTKHNQVLLRQKTKMTKHKKSKYKCDKMQKDRILLNFIEIHSKIYKKLSLSRNLNLYLVIPKYCKFVHLKMPSVIQENFGFAWIPLTIYQVLACKSSGLVQSLI